MTLSMTGFGKSEVTLDHFNIKIEIRSLNSKFLDNVREKMLKFVSSASVNNSVLTGSVTDNRSSLISSPSSGFLNN